jgi:hypothetical protein
MKLTNAVAPLTLNAASGTDPKSRQRKQRTDTASCTCNEKVDDKLPLCCERQNDLKYPPPISRLATEGTAMAVYNNKIEGLDS